MKDEIASSFCRPAKLSNGGARHGAAARHRRNARRHPDEDGSYVERAKD